MPDTYINDEYTCSRACAALNKAKEAEALLNQAESLFKEISEDTNAELPDIEDAIVTASALTNDINEAIDLWIHNAEGRSAAE